MNASRHGEWSQAARVVSRFVALALMLSLAGCAQQPASETPAPATEETAAAVGAQPINLRWDNSANCLQYTPAVDTVSMGSSVNFNSSVEQDVTVTAPAGCFSVADTTFVITRGGPGPTMTGYTAGSYRLVYNPAACDDAAGGTGPNIIIDESR